MAPVGLASGGGVSYETISGAAPLRRRTTTVRTLSSGGAGSTTVTEPSEPDVGEVVASGGGSPSGSGDAQNAPGGHSVSGGGGPASAVRATPTVASAASEASDLAARVHRLARSGRTVSRSPMMLPPSSSCAGGWAALPARRVSSFRASTSLVPPVSQRAAPVGSHGARSKRACLATWRGGVQAGERTGVDSPGGPRGFPTPLGFDVVS